MRIVELQEVKEILGLTDTTYDDKINRLLPLVQEDVFEYLNNPFHDTNTQYLAGTLIFNNSTPPTITDTAESLFVTEGFEAGMDVAVEGTPRNLGVYTLSSVTANTLKLAITDELLDEQSSDDYGSGTIRITRLNYPKGLKIYISQIIWENISRATNKDIKSKSLGPSSVTYTGIGSGGYSESIIKGLQKYKIVNMM